MSFISHLFGDFQQLFKYAIVGLASNFFGYLIFLGITSLGLDPKLAMTILYIAGSTLGFFGNKKWAFSHQGDFFGTAIKYGIAHTSGYLMNLSMLWFFVDVLGYPYQGVQAVAIFVVAAFLFIIFRFFVFGGDAKQNRGVE